MLTLFALPVHPIPVSPPLFMFIDTRGPHAHDAGRCDLECNLNTKKGSEPLIHALSTTISRTLYSFGVDASPLKRASPIDVYRLCDNGML